MAVIARGTKINSFDRPLLAIGTANPAQPFQTWPALFHPPIKGAGSRPRGGFHGNWWVNHSAVRFAVPSRIELRA